MEPARLGEALDRWEALRPSREDSALVHEFLMDLVIDPFACGHEDAGSGVFVGEASKRILVVFVPDPRTRQVVVATIGYG